MCINLQISTKILSITLWPQSRQILKLFFQRKVYRTSMCSGNCSPEDNRNSMCQSHDIDVTVLQMRKCGEWVWGQELLPIACTCTDDVLMKA